MSAEASDYWKYVLATLNKQFAEIFEVLPAVYPDAWNGITEEQAFKNRKQVFNVK